MIEVRLTSDELDIARRSKTRARAFAKAGEIAFSKLTIEAPIDKLQVRTREKDDYELVVQEEEDDDATFVLVTGLPPTLRVRGWIKGWQAKMEAWKREGGYHVPHGVLREMDQLGASAPETVKPEQRPCHYRQHDDWWWRLPDGNPYSADPQRWTCGICHPPPWPNVWTISRAGISDRVLHIIWKAGDPQRPEGPSAPPRSVARTDQAPRR